MAITNCVYCNKEITTRSKEHVIQNALGGLYESTDICCPECNNYISRAIDKPFTTIFNPILDNIPDLVKTAHTDSHPPYTGTVRYAGKTYAANFKNGRVTSCPALARELRCDVSKLELEPVSYDFDLGNDAFKTGISKIAFNYALACGVNFELLKPGLSVEKTDGKVSKVSFNYPTLPFWPMNLVDAYLELGTPMELHHNMILYSQFNKLWCYVDLFSTFQYYVLLSQNLPDWAGIYHNYMQTLRKTDRTIPEIPINGPEDAMMYATQYGVTPTMDLTEMTRRVRIAIEQESYRTSMEKVISEKFSAITASERTALIHAQPYQTYAAIQMYFDKNNKLQTETFRTQTPYYNGTEMLTYTDAINITMRKTDRALQEYANEKFNRLFRYMNMIKKRK